MRILLLILFFSALPAFFGLPFVRDREAWAWPFPEEVVTGWMILMAALYWPALIGILLDASLTGVMYVWGALCLCLLLAAAVSLRKHPLALGPVGYMKKWAHGISFAEILALAFVIFHAYISFKYMHIDDDDSVYIAAAATSLDTNTLLHFNPLNGMPLLRLNESDSARTATAPLFVFYAAVCKLFGLRPAVFAHTWYPPILTMYFYTAMAALGRELFRGDRKKTAVFVIFSYLVNMTAYYSIYTSGTFLMIRSWQGKAQFVGAAVPMLLAFFIHLSRKEEMTGRDMGNLLLLFQAAGLMTSMGVLLASILSSLFAVVTAVRTKKADILAKTLICLLLPVLLMGLYFVISKRGGLL
ncbi:MAG: DUF6077 domain-containing protein [Lachnospiraceae bacterium]|nr:DUF6077 domain-containing protein [Lachnospiraceae bacterium]